MKNILVTGGAGYIGSKLITRLLDLKFNVTCVDKLNYGASSLNHLFFYKNFKFIKSDINNKKEFLKIIKKNPFDFVIPLAALVGAPLCDKNKKEALKTNLDSIQYLVCKLKNNQKIIYPTTNSGYGIGQKNKYCDENSPLNPISLYGRTKAEAEQIVLSHKNSVCFRLATVFGYSYRMRTDLLVNNFVFRAIKEKKLEIFEGHFRRNFIHINDVIEGMIFAINNFKNLKSETYNLGLSSANISKIELAKKIKKFLPTLKIIVNNNKKDPDQRDYFVSNKKIENKGFKAKISLELGIEELKNVFENSSINYKNNY